MNNDSPLPQDKKLTVVCGIEPGCLGPEGVDHVEKFCSFAQKELASADFHFVHWVVVPRYDKTLPETHYEVNHKKLSRQMASTYLELFKKNIDEFEKYVEDKIVDLIERYMGH